MSDLIRREDAINAICEGCTAHTDYECAECGVGEFFRRIANIKTVDAVEVVRCAECKHASDQQKYTNGAVHLLKVSPQCPMYDYYDHLVTASGYCQAGIRRKSTDGGEKDE